MSENLLDFKTISSLDNLFSKVDLYQDIIFEIYKEGDDEFFYLNKDEYDRFLSVSDINRKSIDAYCIFCEKEYSFDVSINCYSKIIINDAYFKGISLGQGANIQLERTIYSSTFPKKIAKKDLVDFSLNYFDYFFTCNKKNKHVYKMYVLIVIDKGKLIMRKIGQFPSKIDIWGFDFDKYKQQLNKIKAYDDFKKAELCMSDKLFAGAFTYLRRVFEKMLNNYCENIDLKRKSVEERIKNCKDKFDERIHPMLKNLYKILSKGIHQLEDDESENYYIYLRAIIEMQLEHIKETNDKEEQTKHLNDRINLIAQKIEKDT